MIYESNFQDLYTRQIEVSTWAQHYPTIAALLPGTVKRWEANNDAALKHVAKKQLELYEAHIAKNHPDDFATKGQWAKENPGNPMSDWKYKSEEDKIQFNAAWAELMAKKCTIVL